MSIQRIKPYFRPLCENCDRPSSDHVLPFTEKRCPNGEGVFTPREQPVVPIQRVLQLQLSPEELGGLKRLIEMLHAGRDVRVLLATEPMVALTRKVNLKHRREG